MTPERRKAVLETEYKRSTLTEMGNRRGISWQAMQQEMARYGITLRPRGGRPVHPRKRVVKARRARRWYQAGFEESRALLRDAIATTRATGEVPLLVRAIRRYTIRRDRMVALEEMLAG